MSELAELRLALRNAIQERETLRIERDAARQELAALKTAPAETCEWQDSGPYGFWLSSCGAEYSDEDGNTPTAAGMRFCYQCGKRVVEVPYVAETEDE